MKKFLFLVIALVCVYAQNTQAQETTKATVDDLIKQVEQMRNPQGSNRTEKEVRDELSEVKGSIDYYNSVLEDENTSDKDYRKADKQLKQLTAREKELQDELKLITAPKNSGNNPALDSLIYKRDFAIIRVFIIQLLDERCQDDPEKLQEALKYIDMIDEHSNPDLRVFARDYRKLVENYREYTEELRSAFANNNQLKKSINNPGLSVNPQDIEAKYIKPLKSTKYWKECYVTLGRDDETTIPYLDRVIQKMENLKNDISVSSSDLSKKKEDILADLQIETRKVEAGNLANNNVDATNIQTRKIEASIQKPAVKQSTPVASSSQTKTGVKHIDNKAESVKLNANEPTKSESDKKAVAAVSPGAQYAKEKLALFNDGIITGTPEDDETVREINNKVKAYKLDNPNDKDLKTLGEICENYIKIVGKLDLTKCISVQEVNARKNYAKTFALPGNLDKCTALKDRVKSLETDAENAYADTINDNVDEFLKLKDDLSDEKKSDNAKEYLKLISEFEDNYGARPDMFKEKTEQLQALIKE